MRNRPLHPSVRDFFVRFSRFEYALKRAGYVTSRGRGLGAEVDWTAFAQGWASAFDAIIRAGDNAALIEATEFIRNDPPRKLVLAEDRGSRRLHWKRTGPTGESLAGLLILVRRVRNNLFHGEKQGTIIGGNQRGLGLVTSALHVVNACVSLDPTVRRYFDEYAEPIPRLDRQ
jgi:hypothetical protein